MLETQRTQLNTQDSLASSGADLAIDQVRLYKALGGGWRADAADAITSTTPSIGPGATARTARP